MCLSLRTDAVLGIGGVRMGVCWFIMDETDLLSLLACPEGFSGVSNISQV